jgi:molybdopterin converting factor small subunit
VNVTVRYHGIIGDMLRRKTQQVEIPDGATVTDLLAIVSGGDEAAQSILKQTRAFIDGKQADRTMPLADGAEVTFMRPIAGGAASLRGCQPLRLRRWRRFRRLRGCRSLRSLRGCRPLRRLRGKGGRGQ